MLISFSPGGQSGTFYAMSKGVQPLFKVCPGTTCVGSKIGAHAIFYIGNTQLTKRKMIQAAAASHVGVIRMPITWVDIQATDGGAYSWTALDYQVDYAKLYNLDIMGTIAEIPPWASSASGCPGSCPGDARFYAPGATFWDDWQAFITALTNRYGSAGNSKIRLWEVGAEANLNAQWKGTTAEFARFFAHAYDNIKASDAGATVGMGSMQESGQPTWFNAVIDDATYPALGRIDVIDVHIRGTTTGVQTLKNNWVTWFANKGLTGKPIWITEFGFPTDPAYQGNWDPAYVGANAADGLYKQKQYYDVVIPWFMANGVNLLFVTLDDVTGTSTGFDSEGIIDYQANARKEPGFGTVVKYANTYH